MSSARARLALLAGVFFIALGAGGWVLGQGFRTRSAGPGAKLFDQVFEDISKRYVDSIDAGTLYARAAEGMVSQLGDPHSVFLDSARLARVQARISDIVGSLGLEVDARNAWVNVVAASANSPAEQVGLRAGDRIVAIEGRSTHNWTVEEARRALRGLPGTTVKITVERLGTLNRTELTLEREALYLRPVQRAMLLENGVGYVKLSTFSDSAGIEVSAAIDSLYKLGMRALVFDLRGNPGGLLAQGNAVAELFLNPGQAIVSLRGRGPDGRRDYMDQHKQAWGDLRLTVLVDRSTASASEIVAGALQDHDRALVIGRPTYGKGSAQSVFSFRDGAGVKLTTARWYTPSGRNIDYASETPLADVPAPPTDSAGRPVFKTDSGRKVFGGGGIVPDVLAGDSINAPYLRAVFAVPGSTPRRYSEAVAAEAAALAKRGVSGPMFEVTPEMRDGVYARLVRSGAVVPKATFDRAAESIDRRLGAETVRAAFGRPAEERRLVVKDKVVQEAIARLRAAKTTRDLLGAFLP
jgi:carboxyl-terminal processing protease